MAKREYGEPRLEGTTGSEVNGGEFSGGNRRSRR